MTKSEFDYLCKTFGDQNRDPDDRWRDIRYMTLESQTTVINDYKRMFRDNEAYYIDDPNIGPGIYVLCLANSDMTPIVNIYDKYVMFIPLEEIVFLAFPKEFSNNKTIALGENLFNPRLAAGSNAVTNGTLVILDDGFKIVHDYSVPTGIYINKFLLPNKTYTCSRIYNGTMNTSNGSLVASASGKPTLTLCSYGTGYKSATFTTPSDLTDYQLYVYGNTNENSTITNIKVVDGTIDVPYSPYKGLFTIE